MNHYDNNSGTSSAKPHVNVYCNGARVLSVGYNPATGQTQFPLLNTPGPGHARRLLDASRSSPRT